MNTEQYTNWLEIDLSAVQNNVRQMQQLTGRLVLAVVKANAYGHGLVETARAAVQAGAPWLGVARVEEAFVLRQAGLTARILVLGYTPTARVAEAAAKNITLAIASPEAAEEYSMAAMQAGRQVAVHAKIDTGMGRLGVLATDGVAFIQHLKHLGGLVVEGIFTHFARADEREAPTTQEQIDRFQDVLSGLNAIGLRPGLVHAANSAASIYFPAARYDMVRPGIALYGLDPSPEATCPPTFRKALSWKTRLISVKYLPGGYGVGYGHRYITPKLQRIGVLAVGYADGMRRILNVNQCIVCGQKLPMIGGICMDQCMIPLDKTPDAKLGDEVVLIGQQNDQRITPEDVAAAWGTINYEVVTSLATRVPRINIS